MLLSTLARVVVGNNRSLAKRLIRQSKTAATFIGLSKNGVFLHDPQAFEKAVCDARHKSLQAQIEEASEQDSSNQDSLSNAQGGQTFVKRSNKIAGK
eukprot:6479877-Karenia_brevis.AAC.1